MRGLSSNVIIDQKCFELKKLYANWWRITESSTRAVKFISLDHESLGWLAGMVKEASGADQEGSSGFHRSRRNGAQVLVVQRQRNSFGNFVSVSEFGIGKRRGILVIPEGRKGVGWRNFGELLEEGAASSPVMGRNNRGSQLWVPPPPQQGHHRVFPAYREALSREPKLSGKSGSPLVLEQVCDEDGRFVSGLFMETLMQALVEMETQVGYLNTNLDVLKRCVMEGMQSGLADGPQQQRPVSAQQIFQQQRPISVSAQSTFQPVLAQPTSVSAQTTLQPVSISAQLQPVSVSAQLQPISISAQRQSVSVSAQLQPDSVSAQLQPVSDSTQPTLQPVSKGQLVASASACGSQPPPSAVDQVSPTMKVDLPARSGLKELAPVVSRVVAPEMGKRQCGFSSSEEAQKQPCVGSKLTKVGPTARSEVSEEGSVESRDANPNIPNIDSAENLLGTTEMAQKLPCEVIGDFCVSVIPPVTPEQGMGSRLGSVSLELGGFSGDFLGKGTSNEPEVVRRNSDKLLVPRGEVECYNNSVSVSELQLVLVDKEGGGEEGAVLTPLCSLPPSKFGNCSSN